MAQHFKRKEILFTDKDVLLIERAAKKHGLKFGPFVKAAVVAYLKGMYIVPSEEEFMAVIYEIKKCGVNINQVAFMANRNQSVLGYQIQELQKQINEIEKAVKAFMQKPDNLNDLVRKAIRLHPRYKEVLQQIIDQETQ